MRLVDGKIKLDAKERSAFFARNWPALSGSGPLPDLQGTTVNLSSRLSFEVERVQRVKKGWLLEYRVVDDRDERFFLMPAAASFRVDDDGEMTDLPAEEELGYTKNPKRHRADPLPSVSPNVQKVIDMRARLTLAQRNMEDEDAIERLNRQRARALNRALTDYAVQAARLGVDATPFFAQVERLLVEATEEEAEAA